MSAPYTVDTLYQQANEIWGYFDLEQFIGSLPRGAFEKAQELAGSEEFARVFLGMLAAKLTPEEQSRTMAKFQKEIDGAPVRAAEVDTLIRR
jgi:hypothetical protein